MSKVILSGYITVPNLDLELVKGELPNHIELTRKEKGCLVFEVSQDTDNHNQFNVYEEFIDIESFEFHQQRIASSKWGTIAKNVKRHYQIDGL